MLLLLLMSNLRSTAQYFLQVIPQDKDSLFRTGRLGLETSFKTQSACMDYISRIPAILQAKGYMTASVDSLTFDEKKAAIHLYVGELYRWAYIDTRKVDPVLLMAIGWNARYFSGKPLNFAQFRQEQQTLLNYLENNGYPFAKISLDSVRLRENGEVSASLKIDQGPLYHIDSIRVYGNAKISNEFLQRYLNITEGSIYRKDRLQLINKRLAELPYVEQKQPWSLTMVATGSVLNLYLKSRKSSQIDVLVGFLPATDQLTGNKLLVTGQATINLKNAFGNGEGLSVAWQQLQPQTPQLDLSFTQPYLFNSPFGLDASFSLYKKDSSYININALAGLQYSISPTQTTSVFLQTKSTNVLNVDTLAVIASHALPVEADVTSVGLGVDYEFNNTNYRFNPRKGNEFSFYGMAGTRQIKKNSVISNLVDPSDSGFNFNSLYDTVKLSSYEFEVKIAAAHYFPLAGASTLKLGFNGGVFSSPDPYRNELFLIGGYKLLRGFDEESILAAQYAVGTLEYRYLVGVNSFMFSFMDLGWAKNNVSGYNLDNTFLGFGVGMAFETKAGIFNMSYAVGKRNDSNLSLQQAKIHLGYVSFF
ncbi:MAG: POTRA domain-containing protein [Puia sp.]|nr:POTRA domain-containing protein [Puia sp.]